MQTEVETLTKEKNDALLTISTMQQSKLQMKEVFTEKEAENERLKKKVEELQIELSEGYLCETFRNSVSDLSLSRPITSAEVSEIVNYKFYSNLLTVSEGVLYKNRYVEVGIAIKIENCIGKGLLYIGNYRNKELENIETVIESKELKIEINAKSDNLPLMPHKQTNRILFFEFEKWFESVPCLVLKYNHSIKVLKLPITALLFLNPSQDVNLGERWEKLMSFSEVSRIPCKSELPLEEIIKKLTFYPGFQYLNVENVNFLHCEKVIMTVEAKNSEIIVEIRCEHAELQKIVNELIRFQIKSLIS